MNELISKEISEISENIKDRIFSPMYFYFIISWIITNWKFVYSLLFLKPEYILEIEKINKITFLQNFYFTEDICSFSTLYSICKLALIPFLSAYIIITYFTKISEYFYEKYEEHKINKRIILKKLEYDEKVKYASEQRKIREAEADKNTIDYKDNQEFNEWFDSGNSEIIISGIKYLASETLYNNDFEAYKEALESFNSN